MAKRLGIEISPYMDQHDPTKANPCSLEWTISSKDVKTLDKQYSKTIRELVKNRKKNASDVKYETEDFKIESKKMKKELPCITNGESETIKQEDTEAD